MTRDPRIHTPEPSVGSGDPSPSVPESAMRPAPDGDVTPEVDADGEAPAPLVSASAEEEDREPEAVDVAALAEKAAKADEYLDLAQRTRAEFENYRRRVAREAAAAQERGAVKLALELLPAIDNLDRAIAHAAASSDGENGEAQLVSGIKHVHSDVLAALKRSGIEPFSPEGEPFDPQFHEAVAQQPVEGADPGTVVEVYQRGYRFGESVLRPARVVVAG